MFSSTSTYIFENYSVVNFNCAIHLVEPMVGLLSIIYKNNRSQHISHIINIAHIQRCTKTKSDIFPITDTK